ncbi:hypothetical protein ABEB36_013485 [Hypothenemus hampei]|uniref:MADF domain-containing protein n=1 Tax=Hypothenemus hampei TaxID=57062 RepID=A0ABD1E742_HYPHA
MSEIDKELFVMLVETRQVLYDKKCKGYRDVRLKQGNWNEISVAMGISVEECQRLWKNLREAHDKDLKKIKQSKPSGSDGEPTVNVGPYFANLRFLDQHIAPRRSISNTENRNNEFFSAPSCSGNNKRQTANDFSDNSQMFPSSEETTDTESSSNYFHFDDKENEPPKKIKNKLKNIMYNVINTFITEQKKSPEDDIISEAAKSINDHFKLKNKINADQAFGNFVASRLEEMSPGLKMRKRLEIMQILETETI